MDCERPETALGPAFFEGDHTILFQYRKESATTVEAFLIGKAGRGGDHFDPLAATSRLDQSRNRRGRRSVVERQLPNVSEAW